jgi:hypothetical protein
LTKADEIELKLQDKQKLLTALTPVDYERIPKLLEWLVGMRKGAENADDKKARLERYDLIEKLCKLSI